MPRPEKANSVMLVRPITTNPAVQHALHHRGVGARRRGVGQHLGAGRRRLAGDVEQVLHAERDAGVAGRGAAGAAQRVDGVGLGAGLLGMDAQEGAAALARRILDAGEAILHQLAGGGGAGGQRRGEFVNGVHGATVPPPWPGCKTLTQRG